MTTQITTAAKLKKISSHKGEASYAFGDYRIYTERKSEGDGVYRRRQSWTSVCVAHMTMEGTDWGFGSVKSAVEAIKSGNVKLLGGI